MFLVGLLGLEPRLSWTKTRRVASYTIGQFRNSEWLALRPRVAEALAEAQASKHLCLRRSGKFNRNFLLNKHFSAKKQLTPFLRIK